jgi:hypothetical protein
MQQANSGFLFGWQTFHQFRAQAMTSWVPTSFRARRAELAACPEDVQDVLDDGGKRARAIAQKTMDEVSEAIQLP